MILLVSLFSKNTTPTAWMMAVRISVPIPVPFLGWITSAEHYWITFAERRRIPAIPKKNTGRFQSKNLAEPTEAHHDV